MHLKSLNEGKEYLSELWKKNESLGTVHTLGALHEGHGILIRQSASENEHTIATIYPNKIQLFPGLRYKYNLEKDVEFALKNGATAVISSNDFEMFPTNYRTFIDQGKCHSRLNSSIFHYAARGQITGTIRWLNYTRPNRSYFGMKDIEQSILIKRAVEDLLIPTEIIHVPCIRFRNGVPISSRLMGQNEDVIQEVGKVFTVLNEVREFISQNQTDLTSASRFFSNSMAREMKLFDVLYTTFVEGADFSEMSRLMYPFIIHTAVRYKSLTHFDGLVINSPEDLYEYPPTIWLDKKE